MVQATGRKNLALDQPKVVTDVITARLVVDLWMTDGIKTILVGPRLKGREVEVVNLFVFFHHVMGLNGIGATSKECVSGLKLGHELEGVDEGTDGFIILFTAFPLAFPHDNHAVSQSEQSIFFEFGFFVDVAMGLVIQFVPLFVSVREAFGAAMPITSMEFVDRTSEGIVSVNVKGFVPVTNHVFTPIAGMTDASFVGVIEVTQPFHGCMGARFSLTVPSTHGFRGQPIGRHVFEPIGEIAGRSDGDATVQGVEPTDLFELFTKDLTGSLEQ